MRIYLKTVIYLPAAPVCLFIILDSSAIYSSIDYYVIIKTSTQFYAKVIKVVPYPNKTLFEILNILC